MNESGWKDGKQGEGVPNSNENKSQGENTAIERVVHKPAKKAGMKGVSSALYPDSWRPQASF